MATEQKTCTFYWKIGACRLGDRCSHLHQKPAYSQTIMIRHMYPNPKGAHYVDENGILRPFSKDFIKEWFENFYADIFKELETKNGIKIEDLYICDNTCEHMFGNVYISLASIQDAQKCYELLKGKYHAGRLLTPEYSPVLDFSEAKCKLFERGGEEHCPKGANCNNLHVLRPSEELAKHLFGERYESYKQRHEGSSDYHRSSSDYYNRGGYKGTPSKDSSYASSSTPKSAPRGVTTPSSGSRPYDGRRTYGSGSYYSGSPMSRSDTGEISPSPVSHDKNRSGSYSRDSRDSRDIRDSRDNRDNRGDSRGYNDRSDNRGDSRGYSSRGGSSSGGGGGGDRYYNSRDQSSNNDYKRKRDHDNNYNSSSYYNKRTKE